MTSWRDRFNRMSGKTQITVCRIFIHLAGREVAPLLGVLNRAAQEAIESEGEMQVLGEGLTQICESLLQNDTYWQSAANEGDVFWSEGDADDYVTELFTDSAQRYGAAWDGEADTDEEELLLPVTENLVVMLTVAYEGSEPALETDLANMTAMKAGLKTLINLHYAGRLRAIQVHFSPARLGDELTADQLLLNFPELVPL